MNKKFERVLARANRRECAEHFRPPLSLNATTLDFLVSSSCGVYPHSAAGCRVGSSCSPKLRSFLKCGCSSLWRSTVGFDRLFDLIDESARWTGEENHYPPYNIERTGEDQYQISLALAGFTSDEVSITAEQNVLTVKGRKAEKREHQYLYEGISARPFRRLFNLADYVEVKAASFEGGLLKIDLVRQVPEAMKPRRIAINAGNERQTAIEHKLAA